MAELVASPIISSLMETLATGSWKDMKMIRGVKEDIEKSKSILSSINSVLDDAEKRSIIGTDPFVCQWLKKLKDAAYDAEDVLADFQYEVERKKVKGLDSITWKVRDLFSSRNTFKIRHEIGKKIKKVIKRLDEITDEKSKFHLLVSGGATIPVWRPEDRQTHAGVIPSKVYGRDEDKEKVVRFLLDDQEYSSISDDIPVLSIVGLGGIGKTTLSQLAYNDERINPPEELFDLKFWVCVLEEFDVKKDYKRNYRMCQEAEMR